MRVVDAVHAERNQIEKTLHFVENTHFPGIAPVNDFYKKHFNLVDLANRQWYSFNESHGNHNWRSKLLIAIMRYFIANVWVLHLPVECETIEEFRHSLACDLVKN